MFYGTLICFMPKLCPSRKAANRKISSRSNVGHARAPVHWPADTVHNQNYIVCSMCILTGKYKSGVSSS